jgi:hypothetical protein
MTRWLRRWKGRVSLALQGDVAFIENAFREILGRPVDADGLGHYRRALREGLGRTAVLLDIMRSQEFTSTLAPREASLPNLMAKRPDRYGFATDRSNGQLVVVFTAASLADFDWLEEQILLNGYYEAPGVWVLGVDADKRLIADMAAAFAPGRPLDLGGAAGAVLECLDALGIAAEGVEISDMAIARAPDPIRARIHRGDLLSIDLAPGFDLIMGFDVFEHLNPNKLTAYLNRIAQLLSEGGFVLCNIPAFGDDPVFATVFPHYLDAWRQDSLDGRPFTHLQCDDLGYPIHGHLIWADATWWAAQFEAAGLTREVEIERAFHAKHDAHMKKHAPARLSYFVFSKGATAARRSDVVARIGTG